MSDTKHELPEILSALRQATNWIVGLAGGGLLALVSTVGKQGPWWWEAVGIAAVILLVATIILGVLCNQFVMYYTNSYQHISVSTPKRDAARTLLTTLMATKKTKLAAQQPTDDIDTQIERAEKERDTANNTIVEHEGKRNGYFKRYNELYFLHIWCFIPGVILSAAFALFGRTADNESMAGRGDVLLLDGRYQTVDCPKYSALLLNTRNGAVQELFNDSVSGGTKWVSANAYTRVLCKEELDMMAPSDSEHKKVAPVLATNGLEVAKRDSTDSAAVQQ